MARATLGRRVNREEAQVDTIDGIPAEYLAERSAAEPRPATAGTNAPDDAGLADATFLAARRVGSRTLMPVCRIQRDGEETTITPIGMVEVTDRKTTFVPFVDPTVLATRAFAFAGFVAALGIVFGGRRAARACRRRVDPATGAPAPQPSE